MDNNQDHPLGSTPDARSSSIVHRPQNNTKTSNSSKPHSPSTEAKPNLLTVPFEIRHRILRLLIGVDENWHRTLSWVTFETSHLPTREPIGVETTCRLYPNILRTCKQLNKEASLILHQENRYVALSDFPEVSQPFGHYSYRFPLWRVSVRDPHEHESGNPCHLHLARGNGVIHPVMTIQGDKPSSSSYILTCVQDLPFVCRALSWMMYLQGRGPLATFSMHPHIGPLRDRIGPLPDRNSLVNIDIRSGLDPSSWVAVASFFRDSLVTRFGKSLGQVKIGKQERELHGNDSLDKQLSKCLNKVNFDNDESRVTNNMLEFTIRKYRNFEACLANGQSSMAFKCIPGVFQMLWELRRNMLQHHEAMSQLEGWISWKIGMSVLDISMLKNNGCRSDLAKVRWAYHFLKRANELLKNVWRDLDAVEHHTRLHLRLAELSLILGLPDGIKDGLLQALVLLTPHELLPPAGLTSDDPLRNNPLPWQQWARGCLEDENSTIREILYFSTSIWFSQHSLQKQTAGEALKKRFAYVEELIVKKFGRPKILTCPMTFEQDFGLI